MPESEVLNEVVETVQAMIPKSLDDIVRKNRDRFAIRFATPADLEPLRGEPLEGAGTPITRWSLIALIGGAGQMVSVHLGGINPVMDRTWMTSIVDCIDGDLVQTKNSLYRLVGPITRLSMAPSGCNQYSPITLSTAGLILARSVRPSMPTGAFNLAVSMAKISSVERTNNPCPGTSTSGAMISTG